MAGVAGGVIIFVMVMTACLFIMAYPVYRVICLWIDRALSSTEAIIYLCTLCFLIVAIMTTWGSGLSFLIALIFIGICVAVPLLDRFADQKAMQRMEDEDVTNFRMTLVHQPTNAYARERLARIYLQHQRYDEALEQVAFVLDASPKDPTFTLLRERIETERRRAITHARVCPKCYAENPPDVSACMECGFRFVDPGDLLRMLLTDSGQRAASYAGLTFGVMGLVMIIAGVALPLAGLVFLFGIVCLLTYLTARFVNRHRESS